MVCSWLLSSLVRDVPMDIGLLVSFGGLLDIGSLVSFGGSLVIELLVTFGGSLGIGLLVTFRGLQLRVSSYFCRLEGYNHGYGVTFVVWRVTGYRVAGDVWRVTVTGIELMESFGGLHTRVLSHLCRLEGHRHVLNYWCRLEGYSHGY